MSRFLQMCKPLPCAHPEHELLTLVLLLKLSKGRVATENGISGAPLCICVFVALPGAIFCDFGVLLLIYSFILHTQSPGLNRNTHCACDTDWSLAGSRYKTAETKMKTWQLHDCVTADINNHCAMMRLNEGLGTPGLTSGGNSELLLSIYREEERKHSQWFHPFQRIIIS